MRLYFFCLAAGGLLLQQSYAQTYFSNQWRYEPALLWEMGGCTGAMNCLTDVGGNKGIGKKFIKDLNWNKTQLCGGLFMSATWYSVLGIRLEGTFGQVSGSDETLKDVTDEAKQRYLRHLSFRTTIAELAGLIEFHPLFMKDYDDGQYPVFSPYLAGGVGFFYYNPQAQLNNVWVDLRPLHTEGQGFPERRDRSIYKPINWCVPLGVGVKYDRAGIITFRFEILYRVTGTDYLDDVSSNYIDPALFQTHLSVTQAAMAAQLADQRAVLSPATVTKPGDIRGNPKNKDAYLSFGFKVALALNRSKSS